jgi:hypothetical protein
MKTTKPTTTTKKNSNKKKSMKDEVGEILGLTKVKGSSGKTYWE